MIYAKAPFKSNFQYEYMYLSLSLTFLVKIAEGHNLSMIGILFHAYIFSISNPTFHKGHQNEMSRKKCFSCVFDLV